MWVWLQRLLTVYVPPPPVVSFAPLLLVFSSLSPSPLEVSLAEQLLLLVFYALSPAENIQCRVWFRLSECHRVHCSTGQSKANLGHLRRNSLQSSRPPTCSTLDHRANTECLTSDLFFLDLPHHGCLLLLYPLLLLTAPRLIQEFLYPVHQLLVCTTDLSLRHHSTLSEGGSV